MNFDIETKTVLEGWSFVPYNDEYSSHFKNMKPVALFLILIGLLSMLLGNLNKKRRIIEGQIAHIDDPILKQKKRDALKEFSLRELEAKKRIKELRRRITLLNQNIEQDQYIDREEIQEEIVSLKSEIKNIFKDNPNIN